MFQRRRSFRDMNIFIELGSTIFIWKTFFPHFGSILIGDSSQLDLITKQIFLNGLPKILRAQALILLLLLTLLKTVLINGSELVSFLCPDFSPCPWRLDYAPLMKIVIAPMKAPSDARGGM